MPNDINDGELHTFLLDGSDDRAKIMLCDEHQTYLEECLQRYDVCDQQSIINISHAIFKLSIQTIGSVDLEKFCCPICAFKKFDFIWAFVDCLQSRSNRKNLNG